MKRILKSSIICVLLLAGCATPMQRASSPCMLPDEEKGKYATAKTVNSYNVKPVRAASDHVNGCASVVFQLDEKGKPYNIKVHAETPADYDYGKALAESVKGSTYEPPLSSDHWYYTMQATVFSR